MIVRGVDFARPDWWFNTGAAVEGARTTIPSSDAISPQEFQEFMRPFVDVGLLNPPIIPSLIGASMIPSIPRNPLKAPVASGVNPSKPASPISRYPPSGGGGSFGNRVNPAGFFGANIFSVGLGAEIFIPAVASVDNFLWTNYEIDMSGDPDRRAQQYLD